MKRFAISLALLLLATAHSAAQMTTTVVANCGDTPGGAAYAAGQTRPQVIDTLGRVCGSGTATVTPVAATTTQAKLTVSVTSTFQAALALSATRKGCTLQYIAVAGTVGYVFFGSATPSDLTTSLQLANRQTVSCGLLGGGVATDQVLVTATQNDIFVVASQ